jgi:hypothetical protein
VNWNRFTLIVCTPFMLLAMIVFGVVISIYTFMGEWRDTWKESK